MSIYNCHNLSVTAMSLFMKISFNSHLFDRVLVEICKIYPGLRLAQPGGPTARVSVLPFLPEDGRRSSFRNVILLKYRQLTKSKKTILQHSWCQSCLSQNSSFIVITCTFFHMVSVLYDCKHDEVPCYSNTSCSIHDITLKGSNDGKLHSVLQILWTSSIIQYSKNKVTTFWELALLPSSGDIAYSVGSGRRG
jgi:hypothetical protein